MDEEENDMWLEDTLKLFNVPIDEYIKSSKFSWRILYIQYEIFIMNVPS